MRQILMIGLGVFLAIAKRQTRVSRAGRNSAPIHRNERDGHGARCRPGGVDGMA
jgi:hypothetical protein